MEVSPTNTDIASPTTGTLSPTTGTQTLSPWIWVTATLVILLTVFALTIAGLEIADIRTDLTRANNTLQQVSAQQQQQWKEWNQVHPQIKNQLEQLTSSNSEQHNQLTVLEQQFETWRLRWEQELSKDPLKQQMNDLQDMLDQAHRHLLLTASVPQTKTLLEQAHALCSRFESTLLQPVCLLIEQDEQALSQYNATDTNKILEQLNQLESHLLLPLQNKQRLQFTPSITNPEPETETESMDLSHYFLNKFLSIWQQIGNFIRDHLVKVHHLHKTEKDLYQLQLPELNELAERLSLLFQQARTALLIQNQDIFQSSITEIQQIAKSQQSMITNPSALIAELNQLQNLTIMQNPPLNLKANEMLARLLKSFGHTNNPASTPKPTAATSPTASP